MTKREAAVVMAYTGVCMLKGEDMNLFYKYLAELFGRPVYTHEFPKLEPEIQKRSRKDFLNICRNLRDDVPDTNVGDTIGRQAAIDAIFGRSHEIIKMRIGNLPSAQKKGRWLPDNNNYFAPYFVCSHCHSSYKVDTVMNKPIWNFCPNCAADMRGEQDDSV